MELCKIFPIIWTQTLFQSHNDIDLQTYYGAENLWDGTSVRCRQLTPLLMTAARRPGSAGDYESLPFERIVVGGAHVLDCWFWFSNFFWTSTWSPSSICAYIYTHIHRRRGVPHPAIKMAKHTFSKGAEKTESAS